MAAEAAAASSMNGLDTALSNLQVGGSVRDSLRRVGGGKDATVAQKLRWETWKQRFKVIKIVVVAVLHYWDFFTDLVVVNTFFANKNLFWAITCLIFVTLFPLSCLLRGLVLAFGPRRNLRGASRLRAFVGAILGGLHLSHLQATIVALREPEWRKSRDVTLFDPAKDGVTFRDATVASFQWINTQKLMLETIPQFAFQGYIVLGQRLVFTEAELAARTGFGWQLVSLTTSFVGIIVSVWFRRAGRLTMRSKGLPKGEKALTALWIAAEIAAHMMAVTLFVGAFKVWVGPFMLLYMLLVVLIACLTRVHIRLGNAETARLAVENAFVFEVPRTAAEVPMRRPVLVAQSVAMLLLAVPPMIEGIAPSGDALAIGDLIDGVCPANVPPLPPAPSCGPSGSCRCFPFAYAAVFFAAWLLHIVIYLIKSRLYGDGARQDKPSLQLPAAVQVSSAGTPARAPVESLVDASTPKSTEHVVQAVELATPMAPHSPPQTRA